ncbi:MAG: hypothetical protein ABIW79_08905, partial [Gemmatimonas sp.]
MPRPATEAPITSPWRVRVDTLRRGEQLVTVLQRAGLSRDEASRALRSAHTVDARRIRVGTTVTTRVHVDSGASEIVLQLAIDRLVRLSRSLATVTGDERAPWIEHEERLEWKRDTVVVAGIIASTLTAAL